MSTPVPTLTKKITAVDALTVTSEQDVQVANELLSQLKTFEKELKAWENAEIKPLSDIVRKKQAEIRPIKQQLDAAIRLVRTRMSEYQTRVAQEAREKQEKIAARMGTGKGKLSAETAALKLAEVETPDTEVETTSGKTQFITDYEVVVKDLQQVPWEYLKVELKKADAKRDLKAGKTIPGLELKEIQSVRNSTHG